MEAQDIFQTTTDFEFQDWDAATLWQLLDSNYTASDLTFVNNHPSQSHSLAQGLQFLETSNNIGLFPALGPAFTMTPPSLAASSHEMPHQPKTKSIDQKATSVCPTCSKAFARPDSLKRHIREKHEDEMESGRVTEHLCPHRDCNRSKKGSGFGRREHLKRHVRSYCKSIPGQQEGNVLASPSCESVSVHTPNAPQDTMDHGTSTSTEKAAEKPRGDTNNLRSGDENGVSSSEHGGRLLMSLKRQIEDERLALDAEKKKRKKRIRLLEALIEELEEK